MKRVAMALLAITACGCLKDGRSEAEFLEDYGRFVDLNLPDPEPDMGDVGSEREEIPFITIYDVPPRECLEEPATSGFFDLTIENTGSETFFGNEYYGVPGFCGDKNERTEIAPGDSATFQAYDGAIFTFRVALGNPVAVVECGPSPEPITVGLP